ncbi:uncharacterized protein LOC130452675 [Diorhabda sublineata]|uniref:uncharacterized protein LOC130452675 n=1 Tax=Diorhabda sublineata TaxID=1163346 RepID=UPI0024E0AEDC|nr:uncharacterized protein LOC130452675 [Diorhabda sublineata]
MRPRQVLCFIIIYSIFHETEEVVYKNIGKLSPNQQILERERFINKVSLTQNGYIQFLKYITDVPPMTEYTFCIWLRSNNLTYNHPILSYSKSEEERLIRFWIGPHGKNINLEIDGNIIFDVPVNIIENRWYHICQSWSSFRAVWVLYLNGKIKSGGSHPKLKGSFIKGGGDIVVGQEYTDFDKGLDDGIEGDITGFNFVLSATTDNPKYFQKQPLSRIYHIPPIKYTKSPINYSAASRIIPLKPTTYENYKTLPSALENEKEESIGYEVVEPTRDSKGLLDLFRNMFADNNPPRVRVVQKYMPMKTFKSNNRRSAERFSQNEIGEVKKSLGLLLVELSFDCGYKKGAPLSGPRVLINWTKSPVRVFGGAILKTIPAFCYENSVKTITDV